MKFIKISLLALVVTSLTSCLKSKNDFAGMRTDPGGIVTSIGEAQYINADAQNIGFGWGIFSNFSFTTPNESVKFFTLHISQPRDTKLSGNLVVKVAMSAHPGGYTLPPTGAITITDITVPASSEKAFDFPVKFAVNKSLLDPNDWYGATFTITSVSQGVFSDLDKSVDVVFNDDPSYNTSKYTGRYVWTSTLSDPAGQYTITNNKKFVNLEENAVNSLDVFDWYAWALSANAAYRYLWANNTTNGINTAIFRPRYNLDATGKIISITNASNVAANLTSTSAQVLGPTAVSNIALDASAPNQLIYTTNDDRKMSVKYSFDLTTTINGSPVTRKVAVTESWAYDAIQAFY